jgi:hypothetical protein
MTALSNWIPLLPIPPLALFNPLMATDPLLRLLLLESFES